MAVSSVPPRSARSSSTKAGEYHPAFEEYCEAIFELEEDSVNVIQARIADRLEISRPAVSEMIHRMVGEGLITLGTSIQLTDSGQRLAEAVVRRHRLAERLLTDILGLSWSSAHAEAGKWEHVISAEVEVALTRVLGEPTTCPHGNPIPGSDYSAPSTVALNRVDVDASFTVSRIPEELEFADGMLDYLEEHRLCPGSVGVLTSSTPDGGRTVRIDGRIVNVDAFASERILVTTDTTATSDPSTVGGS